MGIFAIFLLISCPLHSVLGRDMTTIDFVNKYVENEQSPTYLIYCNICWNTDLKVELAKKLSSSGFRCSSSFETEFKYYDHNTLFLLDAECPDFEEFVETAISRKLFTFSYRWLILDDNQNALIIGSPIYSDSDVVVAERTEYGFKMTEIHKPSNTSSMFFTPRGHYNASTAELTDTREHRSLFRRRRNVMRAPITMANVIQDSNSTQYYLPREERLELQYDVVAKVCWVNVKIAFEMLNATPQYIFSHRWGYKQNGQWSGMVNDLHNGNADLGTNCLVSDPERLSVVTYTDTLASFRVRFIFRQPPLSYVSNIFSLPFSSNVWVAIAACAAVATVAFYLTSKWEARNGTSPTQLDGSIGDALLLTMSAVSQQGCVLEPRRVSGRIMLWIFFTALMALYAAYAANIVVLLQAPSKSIRNLAQLANSKITLAANDVDYNHFVFSLYPDPVRVTIYKRVDPDKGRGQFYDIIEGAEKIRQGLFAFHSIVEPVYRRIEKTFLESEKCDLVEVDYLNAFEPLVPVKKDSPYLELLRVVFKQIRETGVQSAVNRRFQIPKPRCSGQQAAFSSVGLLDLRPVCLLMVHGTLLSVAILFMEVICCKLLRSKTMKQLQHKYKL
ncbi:glutamate receptor ionotropic, delta-1 [Amyelois transitella]|uniref:glutamate receptor ionotropic, delta-1 n=1 Tax=Amyelois transitella TaxID=680683 RepID=UPI00298F47B8|nr:glutamate receptor ionotropic, delta-1 [Amyelois transitella]